MSNCKDAIVSAVAVTGILASVSAVCQDIEWRQLPPLPDPCGFASPFVGVAGETLMVAGGANFPEKQLWEGGAKTWHDTIFALQDEKRGWQRVGTLPTSLGYGISITTESGVLCAGGSNKQQHFDKVFFLKWENDGLTREGRPSLPTPIALCAAARVGDIVYVAGGLEAPDSKEASNAFWAFDLKQPEKGWNILPGWPGVGRFQAVAAALDGWFYLFSGLTYEKDGNASKIAYLKDAWRYSPETGWQKLPDLPHAAAAAASPAPADRGGIYLVGGVDGGGAAKSPQDFFLAPQRIQRYSVVGNSWEQVGNAPVGRVCVTTTKWQGSWILPSGERSAGVRSPEIWSLRIRERVEAQK